MGDLLITASASSLSPDQLYSISAGFSGYIPVFQEEHAGNFNTDATFAGFSCNHSHVVTWTAGSERPGNVSDITELERNH